MELKRATTLCALTLALASCREESDLQQIAHDLPRQLQCAASSVDKRLFITPSKYKRSMSVRGDYKDSDKKEWKFYAEYPLGFDLLATTFFIDSGTVDVTHRLSPPSREGISVTYDMRPSDTEEASVSQEPFDEFVWKDRYKSFLRWAYTTAQRVCDENPFAHEVTEVNTYDGALARTDKQTLVYFKADLCFPCTLFEDGILRSFMRNNNDRFDLVIVNIGREEPFTTREGWDHLLKERYKIESLCLPLVVFLDPQHRYKGHHIGNTYDFLLAVKDNLGPIKD